MTPRPWSACSPATLPIQQRQCQSPWRLSHSGTARACVRTCRATPTARTGVMTVGTVLAQSLIAPASHLSPGVRMTSWRLLPHRERGGSGRSSERPRARKASATSQLSYSRHPVPRIRSFAPSAPHPVSSSRRRVRVPRSAHAHRGPESRLETFEASRPLVRSGVGTQKLKLAALRRRPEARL
ncbi:hypothetical protein L226DRAFT_379123 [Lentinus tigrinus ALCF2SS1-7]|uniref:uncharacterized protein n=1 Tax=Lentinus tigrinus ALCF2SS1-7 TaxID=1328758 RepID=UPI001165F6B1|nr:hypothetical protein L226DRAFT_379123 [Lentinus tigrinus ALCF2SS1-7]